MTAPMLAGLALALAVMAGLGAGFVFLRQRLAERDAFRAALYALPAGAVIAAPTGRLMLLNTEALTLLGLPPDLKPSQVRLEELALWAARLSRQGEAGAAPWVGWVLAHATGARPAAARFEHTRRDGGMVAIDAATLPDGSAALVLRDISERRHALAALAAAREASVAASRARASLLGNISHDWRTPLNAILGTNAAIAGSALPGGTLAAQTGVIADAARSLLARIDDLLGQAELGQERPGLQPRGFVPREILQQGLAAMSADANARGIALAADIPRGVPESLLGDPDQLARILRLMLEHAIAAAGTRRHLVLRADAQTLAGDAREFSISIDVDGGAAPNAPSLAPARALCERLGGGLDVVDIDDKTQVRLTARLRLRADSAPPAAERALHVLVADDNETNRGLAVALLNRLGHTAAIAANGIEALAALDSQGFDLVLMDLMMPELDGAQTTHALRRMAPPAAAIPVIGITASILAADREACLASGMTMVLHKPLTGAALQHAIRTVMNGQEEGLRGQLA